jgi:hypothetical protein
VVRRLVQWAGEEGNSVCPERCHATFIDLKLAITKMDYRQQEVVKLNQIGVELYQLQKLVAASFHFNEALRVLSKISIEREEEEKKTSYKNTANQSCSSGSSPSSSSVYSFQPKRSLKLPKSLLQPLAVDPTLPLVQPIDWDRVYAITIIHNIALAWYAMNCLPKAETMLRQALKFLSRKHQMSRFRYFGSSTTIQGCASVEIINASCEVEQNHYDMYSNIEVSTCVVIMSIYHMLGTVISEMAERTIFEVLECYMEAFHAGQKLGGHLLVACVCVSMGRVFVREGCILEALYAYDMAKSIYSTLEAGDFDDCLDSQLSLLGCSGAAAA